MTENTDGHESRIRRRTVLKRTGTASVLGLVGVPSLSGTAAAGIGDGRILDFHLNNVNYDRDKGDIVAGHVHDASPEGNNGTWYDHTVDPVVAGPVGNAYAFGGGEYITVADDSSLQLDGPFTAAGWVKFAGSSPSPSDYEFFLSKRSSSGTGEYQMYYAKDQGALKYWNGSTIYSISLDLAAGTWHHLAWVFDGSEFIGYHDGSEIGRTSADAPLSGTNDLYIGKDNIGNSINAMNDEVRLYNRALSSAEVSDLATMDEE